MKYLALIFIVAITGCSNAVGRTSVSEYPHLLSAAGMIGLDERTNRSELKRFTGVDPVRIEWCAAFVNAILNLHDIPGSESVSDYPLTARSFLKWGTNVDVPKKGDIVVFPRGNSSWQGHVGFYVETRTISEIDYYVILGGNQDNKVSFELYPAYKAIAIRRHY